MTRMISFAATIPQVYNQTKTVTRRNGWDNLKVGERLWAVEKAMGLKKGQSPVVICQIEVTGLRWERLNMIDGAEAVLEGFHKTEDAHLVGLLCRAYRLHESDHIHRIEFKYVPKDQEL